MKFLLLLIVAAVAVFATDDQHDDHDEEINAIEKKLMQLVARGYALNTKLDNRNDPARYKKSKSMIQRIKKIQPSNGCAQPNHFNCDRFDPQCVNILFFCDGKKDCRNGRDEQYCDLPIKEGDKFRGEVIFDKCTARKPKFIDLNIRKIKTELQGYTQVKASFDIEYEDDGRQGHATLYAKGMYWFSSKTLHLNPPEADQLGFYCTFDWGNLDKCVGLVKREASGETCAKFIFKRTHDHDDDDNDHDHHQHDDHQHDHQHDHQNDHHHDHHDDHHHHH